jgi:hypothetical protein
MKNMSNKVNILKKIKSAQWVSIYQDNPDKFNYGRILACNDTDNAVILASPEGKYDGLLMIETDSITHIEYGGGYSTRMSRLIDEAGINAHAPDFKDEDIRSQMLRLSKDTQRVVSIEILDSGYDDVTGIVRSIDGDCVSVNIFDTYGFPDGTALISMEDITQISLGGDRESTIQRLIK